MQKYNINWSVDFILGLPGETADNTRSNITWASSAGARHLSLYMLDVSEKKTLAKQWRHMLPDENELVAWYADAVRCAEQHGFLRYEVSNFARPGFESKHNLSYWRSDAYIGAGAGASGHYGCRRYTNNNDIERYIAALKTAELHIHDTPVLTMIAEEEVLTDRMRADEMIMLAIRTKEGISRKQYRKQFGTDIRLDGILQYQHLLIITDDTIALNADGFIVADEIALAFMQR